MWHDNLKMMTGLAARFGLSLPIRLFTFAGMCWAAWWFISGTFVEIIKWASELEGRCNPGGVFAIAAGVVVLGAGVIATFIGADDSKWKLPDMLQRAPFLLWCYITDDNETISIWMLLLLPLIVLVDFLVSLCLIVAVVVVGISDVLNFKVRGSD